MLNFRLRCAEASQVPRAALEMSIQWSRNRMGCPCSYASGSGTHLTSVCDESSQRKPFFMHQKKFGVYCLEAVCYVDRLLTEGGWFISNTSHHAWFSQSRAPRSATIAVQNEVRAEAPVRSRGSPFAVFVASLISLILPKPY